MTQAKKKTRSTKTPSQEIRELKKRLAEAEQALAALQPRKVEADGPGYPDSDAVAHPSGESSVALIRIQNALRRSSRALKMISECNQAIVRATDESRLLTDICQIALHAGGYRMAWIGYWENDSGKRVRPVAQSGFEEGYLETVAITWADEPRGQGPTGTAIRESRPVVCRDMLTDPKFAPWRSEALRRGYASSIALPLIVDGETLGAFMLYAAEPVAFDQEEIDLLSELATDLAFGIGSLRERESRKLAERRVLAEVKRFNEVFETLPAYLILLTGDYHVQFANRYFRERFGESNGRRCFEYLFGRSEPCENCDTYTVFKTNSPHRWEWTGPDSRDYDIYDYPFTDADGSKMILEMGIDITEQKRIQRELLQHRENLEELVKIRTTDLRRANESILRVKEEWERTFESVPDLIAILDQEHRIVRVNRAMAERLGVTPDECVGLPCHKLVHGTSVPPHFCPHVLTIRDGQEHVAEVSDQFGGDFIVSTTPLFDEHSRMTGAVHVARDITLRKETERQIEWLARFPTENPNPVLRIGREGKLLYANNASRDLLEKWGCAVGDHVPAELIRIVQASIQEGKIRDYEDTTSDKIFSLQFTPIQSVEYLNVYGRDITLKRAAEKESERRADELDTIFSALTDPLVLFDVNRKLIKLNDAAVTLHGPDALGSSIVDAIDRIQLRHLDGSPLNEQDHPAVRALSGKTILGEQFRMNSAGGKEMIGRASFTPFYSGGILLGAVGLWSDVTEREEMLEKIEASLKEKEVLLKEIHHRVKNNLQIVASMLNLQMESIRDPADRQPLIESQNRIRTLALIHEKLYRSKDLSSIPMGDYIADLASYLVRTLQKGMPVKLETELEEVTLNVGTAIPVALILNELVSNAIKHAFPATSSGTINIRLQRKENDCIELVVSDDGVGLPPNLDIHHTESLGLQLVSVLTKQLEADITVTSGGGTCFTLFLTKLV